MLSWRHNETKFEFYTCLNGRTEFIEFLQTLPLKDKQKLLATISLIQEHGLLIAQRMEWVKNLIMIFLKFAQKYLLIFNVPYTSM